MITGSMEGEFDPPNSMEVYGATWRHMKCIILEALAAREIAFAIRCSRPRSIITYMNNVEMALLLEQIASSSVASTMASSFQVMRLEISSTCALALNQKDG